MKIMVVDLSSDLGMALKSIECALATAKATEKRAEYLLALAKASPELRLKARGIYLRAGARVKKLEKALELSIGEMGDTVS
jgi:hypothetical protein